MVFDLSQIDTDILAAIDLGSNSFHLLLARPTPDGFVVIERLKDKVQLLSGFADGKILPDAFSRGDACIQRFRQRLSSVARGRIYVRGTQALRQSDNADVFIADVGQHLATPVEVISGDEEARLVYLAVERGMAGGGSNKLVIDIGGGSTEVAQGSKGSVQHAASVPVGCVSLTDRHFREGAGQLEAFNGALEDARTQLSHLRHKASGFWSPDRGLVIGTSGTVESVLTVLKANGWTRDTITREGIDRLRQTLVEERWYLDAGLPGLSPDRVDIFGAGAAILCACFEVFGIEEMVFGDVSLLHGILYSALDELGSESETIYVDPAEAGIARLKTTFDVDLAQARRVSRQCKVLYEATRLWWGLDDHWLRLLTWAAELHEIGRQIDSAHYHRHGAYVVKNAQIPGISGLDQDRLSLLVRGHRRGLPTLTYQSFDPDMSATLLRLVGLLRIAVILERSHSDAESPSYSVRCEEGKLHLNFKGAWLDTHPLSRNELTVEAVQLEGAGVQLTFTDEARE